MIRYEDLVEYTKRNHIKWNTDLFDVLRGFFDQYSHQPTLPSQSPVQQETLFPLEDWQPPESGEYTPEDLINLFSR